MKEIKFKKLNQFEDNSNNKESKQNRNEEFKWCKAYIIDFNKFLTTPNLNSLINNLIPCFIGFKS